MGSPVLVLNLVIDGIGALRTRSFAGVLMLFGEEPNITRVMHACAARRYHCEENSVFKAAASG